MTPDEYIAQRLDDQITWLSGTSKKSKRKFQWLRIVEIFAAALIPFLAGMTQYLAAKVIVGVLGVTIAIIAGLLALWRAQEQWIEYRETSEALKREKFLYQTQVDPYNIAAPEAFRLLVQRVEAILSKENAKWTQYMKQPPGQHCQPEQQPPDQPPAQPPPNQLSGQQPPNQADGPGQLPQ